MTMLHLYMCLFSVILLTIINFSSGRIRPGYDCQRSVQGTDYLGTINVTETGKVCQRWDSDFPHYHNLTDDRMYPDQSITKAENFCRNPESSDPSHLWCYTTDPDVEWEYCDVPQCASYPECIKQSYTGNEYLGHEAVTSSGLPCVMWGPSYPDLELNYCRNPDLKPGGPWCFTDGAQTQWEYCDVSFCKPSAACLTTPDGSSYVGTTSMTVRSVPCQRWNSDVPHLSNFTDPADFPDASLEDAEDFCRNPGNTKASPWCYTKDPDVEWDYCDIPTCTNCKISDTGTEYAGTVSITTSGRTCQRWDSQTPHRHTMIDPNRYPDASLSDASNFCRNPDKDPMGPWCNTMDPGVVWEYCDIPFCQDDEPEQLVRHVDHVLHIGIDGLHPCFVNANVSNMIDRIAKEGSYTLKRGRSVIPTVSMPSWSSQLCSMPVESTGITANAWLPQWLGYETRMTPVTGPNVPFPCLVDILQKTDSGVHTAMFHNWYMFDYLASTGSPGRLDVDHYCDAPTNGSYAFCDTYNAMNVSEYISKLADTTERSYTFFYIADVDQSGHDHGWCGPEYLDAVSLADSLVGMVLDAVDAAGIQDITMIIIATDHGGINFTHGTFIDDDLEIPVIFRGPGIKKNYEIQFEVNEIDFAQTIAYAMGFKPSPWWGGYVVDEIFDDTF